MSRSLAGSRSWRQAPSWLLAGGHGLGDFPTRMRVPPVPRIWGPVMTAKLRVAPASSSTRQLCLSKQCFATSAWKMPCHSRFNRGAALSRIRRKNNLHFFSQSLQSNSRKRAQSTHGPQNIANRPVQSIPSVELLTHVPGPYPPKTSLPPYLLPTFVANKQLTRGRH
jgi:hypothetical protein